MEIVILFGGGDAGGIIITAHGIKRIPPFGPEVLRELRAVNSLANSANGKEFGDVASRLSANALAQVGRATGTTGASVMFADGDDFVYCGNGVRPGPIPHGGGVTFEQRG
jgi:hypothetical protein